MAKAIFEHAPSLTVYHFSDARLHLQMQVTLRSALLVSICDHSFCADLVSFNNDIGPLDWYQASRFLEILTEIFRQMVVFRRLKCTSMWRVWTVIFWL